MNIIRAFSFIKNILKSSAFHRHLIFGGINYFITILALHVMLSILRWETLKSLVLFNILLYIYGFFLFRKIIFKHEGNNEFTYIPRTQAIRFAVCMLAFRLSDICVSFFLIEIMGVSYVVTPLIVAGMLFVAKFFVYQKFVFTTMQNR